MYKAIVNEYADHPYTSYIVVEIVDGKETHTMCESFDQSNADLIATALNALTKELPE